MLLNAFQKVWLTPLKLLVLSSGDTCETNLTLEEDPESLGIKIMKVWKKCGCMSRVMQRGVGDISGLFLKPCDKTTCLGSHN